MHHCHLSQVSSYCSMAICILLTLLAVLPASLAGTSSHLTTSTGSSGLPQNTDQLTQSKDGDPIADQKYFLQHIFHKYGHEGVMTFEGFEHLLESLGLGGLVFEDHDIQLHKVNNVSFLDYHDKNHTHNPDSVLLPSRSGVDSTQADLNHDEHDHFHMHDHDVSDQVSSDSPQSLPFTASNDFSTMNDMEPEYDYNYQASSSKNSEPQQKCLSAKAMLATADISYDTVINPTGFMQLCPVIVYELDQHHCQKGTRKWSVKDADSQSAADKKLNPDTVWLYSSAAVLVISLCGLFSVIMIPIVTKHFYQQLIQFLVALAVGSLTGDAFLHLIPHAMSAMTGRDSNQSEDGEHGHDHHSGPVWIGLTAWGGICIFFLAEKILAAISGYRERKMARPAAHDSHELNSTVGEKLYKHRTSSYHDVSSILQGLNDSEMKKIQRSSGCYDYNERENGYIAVKTGDHPGSGGDQTDNNCAHTPFLGDPTPESPPHNKAVEASETVAVHTHGHGHGHSHTVPGTVSNVAWMVILGDGMHNFSDGLAIGAAFADSVTGGLSTAIAVFCHELPHELGDFAMLLKAGMSIRQAICYNGLSSVLCFLGMVIGVLLGNLGTVTPWIFAATAGTFVYIALVDMVPELSVDVTSLDTKVFMRIVIQAAGLCLGCGIMLAIALYEPELVTMLQ